MLAQPHLGSIQLGLHGFERYSLPVGNILIGLLLQIIRLQHILIIVGQLLQLGAHELHGFFMNDGLFQIAASPRIGFVGQFGGDVFFLAGRRPFEIDRPVDRDAGNPGFESLHLILGEGEINPGPHFLGYILGIAGVAYDCVYDLIDVSPISCYQLAKSGFITSENALYKRFLLNISPLLSPSNRRKAGNVPLQTTKKKRTAGCSVLGPGYGRLWRVRRLTGLPALSLGGNDELREQRGRAAKQPENDKTLAQVEPVADEAH